VAADRADVEYLLEAVAAYFPEAKLRPEEITSTWAGLRPLIRPGDNVDPSKVPREHVIATDDNGLISIAGGKLTTHRRMGAEVVQEAVKAMARAGHQHPELRLVDTGRTPLPGAVGWPLDGDGGRMVAEKVVQTAAGRLPEPTCLYLADRYGTRAIDLVRHALSDQRLLAPLAPGRPEILAQVDWAVMNELAVTVTDVLERRTQLYFRDADQGLGAVEAVAGRMAELLGWGEEQRLRSAEGYLVEVARSRRWKSEAPSTGGGQAAAVG
jgi:glycerol-3-phosphate dehydrogenase